MRCSSPPVQDVGQHISGVWQRDGGWWGGRSCFWVPYKQAPHAHSHTRAHVCTTPSRILCKLNGFVLALVKRHTCHLRVKTHSCVFRSSSRCLCVCARARVFPHKHTLVDTCSCYLSLSLLSVLTSPPFPDDLRVLVTVCIPRLEPNLTLFTMRYDLKSRRALPASHQMEMGGKKR